MVLIRSSTIIDEVLDFLISAPAPAEIVAFHASEQAQARLRTLLEHNRDGSLTDLEKAELNEMNRVDHFFTLIKARAMKRLRDQDTLSAS